MKRTSVTAGVPVFNMGPLMKRRNENLLEQTHSDLKILISDNASTDETAEICLRYAKKYPQIVYVRQSENLGQAKNFEFVLKNAHTDMFFLASGDDWHAPSFVTECVAELDRHPECCLCSTAISFLDDDHVRVDWPRKDGELWSTREMNEAEKIHRFMFGASGFYLYSMLRLSRVDPRLMEMAKYTCSPYFEYPWVLGLTMTGSFCHTEATYFTYTLHMKWMSPPKPKAGDAASLQATPLVESNALLFLDRYREVVDELAPDLKTAHKIKQQILVGAIISTGGSLDWYKRAKTLKVWHRFWDCWGKSDIWGICFLIAMQIFRIKPIRLLFRQRIY